jgi:hypothetical protein
MDESKCAPARFGVVGGYGCYWFTHIANEIPSKDRLIAADETVCRFARNIARGNYAMHA